MSHTPLNHKGLWYSFTTANGLASLRVEHIARLWGDSRASFDQSIYAHSSPAYFRCGRPSAQREASARFFLESIDESLKWIDSYGRYNNDQQREDVRELFRQGREKYSGIVETAK